MFYFTLGHCRMQIYEHYYAGGSWQLAASSNSLNVINPSTNMVCGVIPACGQKEVDVAVSAAKKALPKWSALSLDVRADWVRKIVEQLEARRDEIAKVISIEMGMPFPLSQQIQLGLPIATMRSLEQVALDYPFKEMLGNAEIVREPIGICGVITPWNFPLHQIIAKITPAMLAGCTFVVKPSEMSPLCAYMLMEICHDIGLPAGVFNLVPGNGVDAGEAIASHPDISMVSFTGSTRAGVRVAQLAAPTVKRVTQELGGKSASLVLDDANLPKAIESSVMSAYFNSGQTCSAPTRLLIHEKQYNQVVDIIRATVAKVRVGDPFAEGVTHGPIVHEQQYHSVLKYINTGIEEGAELLVGEPPFAPNNEGYFIEPVVFVGVDNRKMRIAREEIFGPVLSVITYKSEDEAIEIANDSDYGLWGMVWSEDLERAKRVAAQIDVGQIHINGASFDMDLPFGGYKQSGNGRELGRWGLEEYFETKAVLIA